MASLWDVLVADGLDPSLDGWSTLITAQGISGDGRYVVGYGSRNGNSEAFLADLGGQAQAVPEASTWAAIVALGAAVGGTAWRRRQRAE